MAVVQSTYVENIRPAVAGMVASMASWDAITRQVEPAGGIGFGLACGQGTAEDGARLGAAAATGFVGISVRDVAVAAASEDKYRETENMTCLTKGEIWVTTGGDVTAGADVTFNSTTGVLSTIAADGSNFAIAGARWMTTATSGNLAIVRLGGALPAA